MDKGPYTSGYNPKLYFVTQIILALAIGTSFRLAALEF